MPKWRARDKVCYDMFVIYFFILSLTSLSNAQINKAPDFALTMKRVGDFRQVDATPPLKYHFNLKAPVTLQINGQYSSASPISKTEELIRFIIPNRGTQTKVTVSIYLCDNYRTFCERHTKNAHWDENNSGVNLHFADPNLK